MRVLIVDDSPLVRDVLRGGLARFRDIQIVGEAPDGSEAKRMVVERRPDVVTMDMIMPDGGGASAIRGIMATRPTPIVVLASARSGTDGLVMDAFEAGAVDVFAKPRFGFDDDASERLADTLRAAASMDVHVGDSLQRGDAFVPTSRTSWNPAFIGLVAGTAGPQTVLSILRHLPSGFSVPIALVQHIADGFATALATWLDANTGFHVMLAEPGMQVMPGEVVVAPDDLHLTIGADLSVQLAGGPSGESRRPAGSRLLRSLASSFGPGAVGVVCSGIGDDGADGLAAIEAAGGVAVVEEPEGAALDQMPLAAIARSGEVITGSTAQIGTLLARLADV